MNQNLEQLKNTFDSFYDLLKALSNQNEEDVSLKGASLTIVGETYNKYLELDRKRQDLKKYLDKLLKDYLDNTTIFPSKDENKNQPTFGSDMDSFFVIMSLGLFLFDQNNDREVHDFLEKYAIQKTVSNGSSLLVEDVSKYIKALTEQRDDKEKFEQANNGLDYNQYKPLLDYLIKNLPASNAN